MKFQGTENYVATQDLKLAVNAAITLKRPLLVKGEPGTGKTMLAEEVSEALGLKLIQWHIKSTTKAQQGLYEYDAVSRLRDSQLGDEKVKSIENYIIKGVLWQAFTADEPVAILIDEIDKADIEFPNDLLREIDRMEFYCYETRQLIKAKTRPVVFITSNNEKELPDAFFASLLLPLHQVPRSRHHEANCGCALSQFEKRAAGCGLEKLLRCARLAWFEKETLHQRTARLAQTLGGRRHSLGSTAKCRPKSQRAAIGGRLAEKRTRCELV